MVFNSIFDFAGRSAGLFSVTNGAKAQPGAGVDFEDAEEDTYDDKSQSLSADTIHGASSRAKVVQEQSPEARIIMGFLGSFIQQTQAAAGPQGYAQDLGSVSTAASDGMEQSSAKMTDKPDLQKNEDLQSKPKKSDYNKAPKTPETPSAPAAGNAPKATADKPSSGSQ